MHSVKYIAFTIGQCNVFQHIFGNQKESEFYSSYFQAILFLVTMCKPKTAFVTYLGCILNETLYREAVTLKALIKINRKLKFMHNKNEFLTPKLQLVTHL